MKNGFTLLCAFGILALVSSCKKEPLIKNDKNTTLSINDIKLYNLSSATSVTGEFKYTVTASLDGTTRDTTKNYTSTFSITNVANQSQTINFDLPADVKKVTASCTITILGGMPEKLNVSSFQLITNGVQKINVPNLEANFSSDSYTVGPYSADY